jgi:hypothetical protein
MTRHGAVLLIVGVLAGVAQAAPDLTPDQVLPRVAHHVREAEQLARHFQGVSEAECRRFATPAEWRAYFNGEIDRMVLMVAHVEQAWAEAKRTGDDEIRRAAKLPRRRLDDARALVDKLYGCAADHGTSFGAMQVWRRIEREAPQRQAEIALPTVPAADPSPASPVSR